MRIYGIILTFVFLGLNATARTLTWNESIELAEKNNSELQAAVATYNSVKVIELGDINTFLPHLSGKLHGSEVGAPSTATTFEYTADLSLTQNLFAGFGDYYTYKLKKVASDQALIDLNLVKARISQELKQTYSESYYAQQNIKLSENILKRRQENLQSVQLQYDAGRENKGSLLLSKANVDSAELDLVHAKNDSLVSFDNFRRYLGLPIDEEIVLSTNIERASVVSELPEFQKLAENNLSVLRAKADEQSAQYTADVSRAKFIPSLDFTADYGYADKKFFPEKDSWSLGLTLTIPLFDGFRDIATHQADLYKASSSTGSLTNIILIALRDLKKTYYDYTESLQNEKVTASFSQAAALRSEIARSKYKAGLISFEDWDLIESDLIQKQKDFLVGERNRITKQSLWEKAQGIGVFK